MDIPTSLEDRIIRNLCTDRFRHLLLTIHNFPMEEQKNILKESIIAWQRDNEQVDDQMVLGFRPMEGIKNLQ